MAPKKGFFIVLYGVNNLGKSTQAKLLTQNLKNQGFKAEYLKYPRYQITPSGPYLDQLIRAKKLQISPEELQMWYTINRFQYQPKLEAKLKRGRVVVAEDYTGTGLAWGAAKGVDLTWLEEINQPLLKEDLGLLLDGRRFIRGKEKVHIHETDAKLTAKCRQIHLKLGQKYGWPKINANQSIDQVQSNILKIVLPRLKRLKK